MKVTVDTNILISATFWSGISEKIINLAEDNKIKIFLSREIIEEYLSVLEYDDIKQKIKEKNLQVRLPLQKLIDISNIVEIKQKFNAIIDDPDDNKIIECAFAGNVEYIISQDKHLLNLKLFRNIKIVSPEEFLRIVEI